MDLESALVERIKADRIKVPPYPAVAMKLSALLASPGYSFADVVAIVRTDQTLAAAALRLANSALYARGDAVADLPTAVQRIGARSLQALALASDLQSVAHASGPLGALRRRAWFESLCSARICALLAMSEGESPEESFVAGLLHDFGRSLAIATLENILASEPKIEPRSLDVWWSVIERYHIELGMVLSARWKLPEPLERVIIDHHEPDTTGLVGRVAVADEVLKLLDTSGSVSATELGMISSLSTDVCRMLEDGLRTLPVFIASFEPGRADGPSRAIRAEAPAPAASSQAVVILGILAHPVRALLCQLEGDKLVVQSNESLPSSCIAKLSFNPEEHTDYCVKIQSCEGADSKFTIKLSPFALTQLQLSQWRLQAKGLLTPLPGAA